MPKKFKKIKLAFQGEKGAFSEIAGFSFFGKEIETIPSLSFREVFEKVEREEADFGIIPIENSLGGTIGENYNLLLDFPLKIYGETILKIEHCLIGKKDTKIEDIKRVYSHWQALNQCRDFLEKFKIKAIPVYDTAGAVKMLKKQREKDVGAIASERAGRIYKMKILKKGIETNKKNFTRFFVISKKPAKKIKNSKTSIVFGLKHIPGALFEALKPFAKRKINLTKIESRPIIGKWGEYHFYLDFKGHQRDEKISSALKELERKTTFLRILGSYPEAKI